MKSHIFSNKYTIITFIVVLVIFMSVPVYFINFTKRGYDGVMTSIGFPFIYFRYDSMKDPILSELQPLKILYNIISAYIFSLLFALIVFRVHKKY